jgi:glutamyl-tRNA synthetase
MAISNYLFARHYGGQFLIRIEDTDRERSDKSLIDPILDALRWLQLDWDGEIVHQSQRLDIYKDYAKRILESGAGYRCFCSPQQLQKDREEASAKKLPPRYNRRCLKLTPQEIEAKLEAGEKFAIRLRIPEGETSFDDMVLGQVSRRSDDIEDFIIARSDGTATYNLAVVVDDNSMGITHVIRGNDHVTNTFKQIFLYRALGLDLPQFGHLPLILRPDKRKVSKRLGDKDVGEYRNEGLLPEAMFNYLCLLGWSPKTEREIYTPKELIEIFTEKHFNASNAVFDEEKLIAFNKEHISRKSGHDLAVLVAPLLVEDDVQTKYWFETRWEYLRQVIDLLKARVRRLSDFVSLGRYFFEFDYKYESKAEQKQFTPEAAELLSELADRFEKLTDFGHDDIEQCLSGMADEKELKKARLIHPTRLAVSGMSVGPGLYDILAMLTRPVVIERMRKAVAHIKNMKQETRE